MGKLVKVQENDLQAKLAQLLEGSSESKEGDFFEDVEETLEFASVFQPSTTSVEATGIHSGLKIGDYFTKYGVLGNPIKGAILSMWQSRVLFIDQKRICSSPDGVKPVHNEIAESCRTCPKAKYAKGKPSECTKNINILFQPEDLSTKPYILQFSKTMYKVGMDLVRQAKKFGDNVYDYTFTMETKKVDGYAYRAQNIAGAEPTSEEMKAIYKSIQDHYKETVSQMVTRHQGKEVEEDDDVESLENIA